MIPISPILPVFLSSLRKCRSIGLHKQNHIHGQCSQAPYTPPAARPTRAHRLRQTGLNLFAMGRIWKISTPSSDPRPSRANLTPLTDGPSRRACSPLLIPNPGRKCRFYWSAQAKLHTRKIIPNSLHTAWRPPAARPTRAHRLGQTGVNLPGIGRM